MRRLKSRPARDALTTQPRSRGGRLGRFVYLTLLLGLGLWLIDAFFGHLIYLRAQGLVVADAAELSSEYTATVTEVLVERGDRVSAGQVVARLRSQTVSERIARIATDIADIQGQLTEAEAELAARRRLVGEAELRRQDAQRVLKQFEDAERQGLVSNRERVSVANELYRALSEVESLRSAIDGLTAERRSLQRRLLSAEEALADLRRDFDSGALKAAFSGLVTDVMVLEGAVVTPGQAIARIADSGRYVLAYRATGTLYQVAVGEPVVVSDGVERYAGQIGAVLPLTAQLPEEFRETFRPAAREQVLRIDFLGRENGAVAAPPLYATVEVRRPNIWFLARLSRLVRAWTAGFTGAGPSS